MKGQELSGFLRVAEIRYEYERAVREGYLVDSDVVAINSNVRRC